MPPSSLLPPPSPLFFISPLPFQSEGLSLSLSLHQQGKTTLSHDGLNHPPTPSPFLSSLPIQNILRRNSFPGGASDLPPASIKMMNESEEDLAARFQMQTPNTLSRSMVSGGGGGLGEYASAGQAGTLPTYDASPPLNRVARETEAKCSKLLADAESRILDERNRYQQKEFAMKEDLLKEKSRNSDATQQKVKDVLAMYRQEAGKTAALTNTHHQTVVSNLQSENKGRQDDLTDKVRRLEAQVTERERELDASNKRHQEEKRELLALRTNQLKHETSRKGEEGEMVHRAMSTIAEYEAAIRKSEAENASRLSEYMDTFTKDWLARARDFEEHKAKFEAETLEKAFQIMRDQETTLAEKEERMRLRMVDVLTQQSEGKLDQEQRLMEQFEKFKLDYKLLQDKDFETRCGMFDQAQLKREAVLFERLTAERQKMTEMEQRAADAAEMQRVQSLNEAMGQLSHMREQILAENHRKQEELQLQLLKQRDLMHQELVDGERLKTEQMATMQQKVIDAMNEAHRIVTDVKKQMAQNEAETHEKYINLMNERNRAMEAESLTFKEQMEQQYFSKLNEQSTAHSLEVKRLSDEFLEKTQQDSSEAFKREQELRMQYDAKMLKFEESTQTRYKRQLQEAADNEAALKDQHTVLKRELAEVNAQVQNVIQTSKTREMHLESRLAKAQRDIDTAKLEAEDELRGKYEKWLEEAMQGAHKVQVDKMELERMRRDAESAEKRSVELVRHEREAMQAQKDQMKDLCDKRNAEERARCERIEADLMERVADLRVELEAEMKRKEVANQRLFETERRSLYEEANERAADDRRDRQTFEERVKDMEEARWKAVNKDIQQSCDERIKQHELRISEREAELDAREAAMRQEKLATQQKFAQEKARLEGDEWDMRSKLEITIRKEAEARLAAERERLQGELDAIRKHAVDQQRAMEEARGKLQRQMEDERKKAELDMQRRYDAMLEQTAEEQREALRQREKDTHERDHLLREKHSKAIAAIHEAHRKETNALEIKLDTLRNDIEAEKAEFAQECKDGYLRREEAIRNEAQARTKAEQEALRQKELQMQFDNDRIRLEMEASARESMQKMFDGRSKHWEEADGERRRAEEEFFLRIKEKLEQGDGEMRSKQQQFEEAMRTFTEKALGEQQRQLGSAQAADVERLQEECARLRAQLAKQKQSDALAETQRLEERLQEHHRSTEREREQERRLAEEAATKQLQDQQRRAEARIAEMTQSYEAQVSKLRDSLAHEKQSAQAALLEKDEEASRKLEDTSRMLHEKVYFVWVFLCHFSLCWEMGKSGKCCEKLPKKISDGVTPRRPEADVREEVAAAAGAGP